MMTGHSGYERIVAIDRFEDARRRAQLNRIWQRLTNRQRRLLQFSTIHRGLLYPSGVNQGIKEIPVRRIKGSLAQNPGFDCDFRPLHKSQRDRWANVWVLHALKGWEPILVHQINGIFFVEDGHHRISVARNLGLEAIEANVITYPVSITRDSKDPFQDILVNLDASYPAR